MHFVFIYLLEKVFLETNTDEYIQSLLMHSLTKFTSQIRFQIVFGYYFRNLNYRRYEPNK